MPVKDLTGKVFNRLTVLERDLTKVGGAAYWICQCECGNIISVRGSNLTSTIRPTRSCGCLTKEVNSTKIDTTSLIGKNFGRLTVIKRDTSKQIGHGQASYWICKCECGKEISIMGTSLTRKDRPTLSCGCLKSDLLFKRNYKDITNQRFGMLVAKENLNIKNNHNSYLWRCECDCGNNNYICSAENLLSNHIISCGCQSKSRGEHLIKKILIENQIYFIPEFTFSDLKSAKNAYLRFDFAIFNDDGSIQRLVEFDGEQHYNTSSYYYSETLIENDQLKNEYCKKHNYILIRIPYTELNNLSIELIMGDKYLIK